MEKKLQRFTILALVIALISPLAFGDVYTTVFAQDGNVERTLSDVGTGGDRVLTSNLVTLVPGQQHTYQVAYDGDDQPISVLLNTFPAGSAAFEIWTDDRLADRAEDSETEPLGRGTNMTEDASFANWQGGSPEAETYFIVVTPTGTGTARYVLNITSPALSADQPGAVAVAPEPPAPDPNVATVTTDALNVREGPSTSFPVIVTVPNGTQMTVLGRNATNTWIMVQLEDGTEGWVTRSLTNYITVSPTILTADAFAAPATTAVTTTATLTTTPAISPTAALTVADPLDDEWVTLSPGETHWYSFQYRGNSLPVTVWMDAEPIQGAGFTVVSADTALALINGTEPTPFNTIGSGRANPVEPGYLFWRGDFPEADTFYVMAQNTGQNDMLYSLNALGPGVGRSIVPVP
jgi:SH3-like domain-containing protein